MRKVFIDDSENETTKKEIIYNLASSIILIPYIAIHFGWGIYSIFGGIIISFAMYFLLPTRLHLFNSIRYLIKAGILAGIFSVAIRNSLMIGKNVFLILLAFIPAVFYGACSTKLQQKNVVQFMFFLVVVPFIFAIALGTIEGILMSDGFSVKELPRMLGMIGMNEGKFINLLISSVLIYFCMSGIEIARRGNLSNDRPHNELAYVYIVVILNFIFIVSILGTRFVGEDMLNSLGAMESLTLFSIRRVDYMVISFFINGIFCQTAGFVFAGLDELKESSFFRGIDELKKAKYLRFVISIVLMGIVAVLTITFYDSRKPLVRENRYYSVEKQNYAKSMSVEMKQDTIIALFEVAELEEYSAKAGEKLEFRKEIAKGNSLFEIYDDYEIKNGNAISLSYLDSINLEKIDDEATRKRLLWELIYDRTVSNQTKVRLCDGREVTILEVIRNGEY